MCGFYHKCDFISSKKCVRIRAQNVLRASKKMPLRLMVRRGMFGFYIKLIKTCSSRKGQNAQDISKAKEGVKDEIQIITEDVSYGYGVGFFVCRRES